MSRATALWALIPAAAFVYGLSFSWGRWGDIVVDWGRELEIARRLAEGDVLYGDVRYWYGPVAPYANALLFALFGVHTRVLRAAGLGSAVLMTALLWALARRLAGTIAAATVAAAFVSLCAFGHYYLGDIFNWATPYAYPATYGMALATGSLYALVRALEAPRSRWFVASLGLLTLALLTKVEPAFAALLAHLAFAVVSVRTGSRTSGNLAVAYAAVFATAAVVGGAFALASGTLGVGPLALLNPRTAAPVVRYMGFSAWETALPAMAASALRLGVCLATPLALVPVVTRTGIPAIGFAGALLVPCVAFAGVPPERALLAMPLVCLLGFGRALWRFVQRPDASPDLVLWAFSLGALARLPLSAGAHHYGFYLLPVPLAAVILVWFRELPALLRTQTTLCACTAVAAVATLSWTHTQASAAMYRQHTAHVVTPRGDVWLMDDVGGVPIGETYHATVDRLRAYHDGTTVLAAPEGAGLAFLAGLPTWGRDLSYYPPETGPEVDAWLRNALEARPPDLVLLTNVIDLRHYGALGFGRDYATGSMAWIQRHYAVDRTFTGNAVVIARRNTLAAPSP